MSLVLLPGDFLTIIISTITNMKITTIITMIMSEIIAIIITIIIGMIITMTTTIVAMIINIPTFQFMTFLKTTREPVTVAVKMLKEGHTDGEMIDFVKVVLWSFVFNTKVTPRITIIMVTLLLRRWR